MIVGGIFWSLTYIFIIRQGFKDKTFGMPFVALSTNISWEAIFSFVHPHSPPQLYIDYAWFSLDLVIVFQFLRYCKSEFPKLPAIKSRLMFLVSVLAILALRCVYADINAARLVTDRYIPACVKVTTASSLIERDGATNQDEFS